jgi:CBS domain-containing protein
MQVRDLMTVEVFSVRSDTAVSDIARLMSKHHVSGVPVLGAEGDLVGIVTELDLIVRNGRLEMPIFLQFFDAVVPLELPGHLTARLRHMLGTRAEDVMTRGVHTVTVDTDVEDLVDLMMKRGVNPVPVLDGGRLAGIVSRSDLVRMMAKDLGTP